LSPARRRVNMTEATMTKLRIFSYLPEAFAAFVDKLGLPRRLIDVGVSEDRFELIGKNAMLSIFTRANPQPIREPADVMKILKLAA
jgi:maleylacetate reductase